MLQPCVQPISIILRWIVKQHQVDLDFTCSILLDYEMACNSSYRSNKESSGIRKMQLKVFLVVVSRAGVCHKLPEYFLP